MTMLPYLFSSKVEKNNKNIYVGNIISDIRSTFHSMYDTFKELKQNWKLMWYLKSKEEHKNDSIEMCYIKSKIDYVLNDNKYDN